MDVQDDSNVVRPRGGGTLGIGIILALVGLAGVVLYLVLAASETPGQGTSEGAQQGLLVWLAALALGAGVALIVIGALQRRRPGPRRT
jgi:hypothetical protein